MISRFTTDGIDLVSASHGRGDPFGEFRLACSLPISKEPTWEVHHSEGVFLARWRD